MKSLTPWLLILASALTLSSCEQLDSMMGKLGGDSEKSSSGDGASPARGFAIIDLNAIAQRTGRSQALQAALNAREQQLVSGLVQLQSNLQNQFNQVVQEAGAEPTEEQSQQIAAIGREMNQRLNQAQNAARQSLTSDQASLIRTFRSEILPVATTVASERGLNTILTKNDSILFAWDPRNDITEEVIKRLATPMVP